MNAIVQAIAKLTLGENLDLELARSTFEEIMSGTATPAQIGGYLVAQRMRGETVDVIQAAAEVMRSKATPIPCLAQKLVDTCGTGGDHSNTFNISTTAAFVAAGAGVKIAKHGNRSVTSNSGSADVLAALGVNINLNPEQVAHAVDQIGLGFLFAPALHGAMKHAIGPRRELGMRSIFNVLGPLTNPAGAKRQVLGVFEAALTPMLAQVLGNLGAEHVWVANGSDGLDEITLCGPSQISEFKDGSLSTFTFDPLEYGFEYCAKCELSGGDPSANAQITHELLSGAQGPKRDIVLLNAAAAILVSGIESDYRSALEQARHSIDSGKALQILQQLAQFSQEQV